MGAGWPRLFLFENTLFSYNLTAEGAGFDYFEQCKFATVKIYPKLEKGLSKLTIQKSLLK